MRLKAIVFDFDGVIVDSVKIKIDAFAEIFNDICDLKTVAYIHEYNKERGATSRYVKFDYCFEHFIGREPEDGEIEKLSERYTELTLNRIIEGPYTKGALEFLKKYNKRINLYIATATPPDDIKTITEAKNIVKYFKGIYGTKGSKVPIIKDIMREYHPDEIVYIGDFHTDLEVAREAGINFIAYGSYIEGAEMFIKDMTYLEKFL